MLIQRSSSATFAMPAVKPVPPGIESVDSGQSHEPFVDPGLPVPDTYDVDIIRALLQDPFRIFIYWEVREESLAGLTEYFSPDEVAKFRVNLRLTEIEGGHEAYFEVARKGRYWMMVFPDREYEFEIGVRSPEHGFIALIKSNRVRTPRGTVSPEPAYEPEFRLTPPQFIDVLDASGFSIEHALDIKVSALPGAIADFDGLRRAMLRLPESLRAALTAAVNGEELTLDMVESLPDWLRAELSGLMFGGGGRLASTALVHYFPELLRESLEIERELIGDHVHPLHVTPRFFVGASESVNPPGGDFKLPAFPRRTPVSGSGFRVPR